MFDATRATWLTVLACGVPGLAGEVEVPAVHGPSDVDPSAVMRLPKDPAAAATLLGPRSNAELVSWMQSPRIERKEPIYEAIAKRREIDPETRRTALEALGKVHGRDLVQETYRVMYQIDRSSEPDEELLRELGPVLLSCERPMLEKQYRSLRTLARYGRRTPTREWGWAALATIGPNDRLRSDASGSRERYFLASLRHVVDAERRRELLPLVETMLEKAKDPDVLAAGFHGLLACDDSRDNVERVLVRAEAGMAPIAPDDTPGILAGRIAFGALAALQEVPAERIPDVLGPRYVRAFVTMQQALQPVERTTPMFRESLEHIRKIAERLGDDSGAAVLRAEVDRLHVPQIVVRAVWQEMRFDPVRVEVVVGRPVEIVFENADDLPQNLVVVEPGRVERVGAVADAMTGDAAFEQAFVPKTDDVLHATKLVEPRESASLVFTAPATPGNYHFISTVAEQWRTMQGTLWVVEATESR